MTTASTPSIAQTFKPGDKLAGCYVLKEMLPLGDFCVVWLAHDEELNKDVALHFVPDSVAADSRAMSELKQEAKRNRQLIHPRIVRVYDLIEDEKWAAISMDHVQGETLEALQAKKEKHAFNPAELSSWIADLCQTLEDAHRVDLVHRDLAPDNLIATSNGLMVLKFGLSRVILDSLARSGQKLQSSRDLAFISPQQLDGERPSREDDLYSLGAVLYDLLTGKPPFESGDLIPQIRKIVPPAVSEKRIALGIHGDPIPAGWDRTVAACLAKTREERPKRASDVATALGAVPAVGSRIAAAPVTAAAAASAAAPAEPKKEPAAENEPAEKRPEPAKSQKRSWGPAKTPIVTEATVLSKTPVSKGEKEEPEPGVEKAAGAERKAGGPTTPTGFPLRAFVEVDGGVEAKKNGRTPVALYATGGVLLLLLIIGYVVARNNNSNNTNSETALTETSSSNGEVQPASNDTEASPSPSPAADAGNDSGGAGGTVAAAAASSATPSATPVAAAPVATPLPVVASGQSPTDMTGALDQAKAALAAAEKDAQAKADAKAQAAAAAAEAQQAVRQKGDAAAAAKKAADAATAALQQQQAAAQKADADAEQAQKAAQAKAQAADQIRKALQDSQSIVEKQEAAQKQAQAEAGDLAKMAAQRQQQADAAAKAAADAEDALHRQAQAVQNIQSGLEQQQMQAEQVRKAAEAQRAAQEAARVQQQRAAETERLAAQAAAAAKAAEDAEKALAAAKKAVEDAEKARAKAEQEAAAARSGMPLGAPAASPAATPIAAPPTALVPRVQRAVAIATPAVSPGAAASPTLTVHVPNPHSKVDATLTNSIGMRFAPVGNVLFSVWLTRVQDFDAFAKATGFKSTSWRQPGFRQGSDHPVVNVSWNDAMQFCLWLTEQEHRQGILALTETYRLPTDLEWSKAVGLPEESGRTPESRDMDVPDVYPWGTQWPPPAGAGNYTGEETDSDVAIKGYNDGFAWTSPVGSFNPNKLGLYDMGGNVWEWCLDWWNPEQKQKVLRGGSWYNGALKLSLLSSCRIHAGADAQTDNYGFRIVLANEMAKPKAPKRH